MNIISFLVIPISIRLLSNKCLDVTLQVSGRNERVIGLFVKGRPLDRFVILVMKATKWSVKTVKSNPTTSIYLNIDPIEW